MHDHHHHHHHSVSGKNLFITIILNVIITISQILGGLYSGSLALLSDALHNFSDVVALLIAYVAHKLSHKEHTLTKTFGYKRAEIIAALFNTTALMSIAIFLVYESYQKLMHPEPIDSVWVIALGVLSIFLNAFSVLLVKDDADHNMNIKAAYLHLLTDMMTSVAVVVGGLLIYFFKIYWVDAVVSIIIAVYLFAASWTLIKDSLAVLMQFVPAHLDIEKIIEKVKEKESLIENIHHVHLWQLDDHQTHLEAHLNFAEDISLSECGKIIDEIEKFLHDEFHISHVTLQCEYERCETKDAIA